MSKTNAIIGEVIEGFDRVVAFIGEQPSFHDAEVHELNFRTGPRFEGPWLDLVILLISDRHPDTSLTLRFWYVSVKRFIGMQDTNAIYELSVEDRGEREGFAREKGLHDYLVRINCSYGFDLEFECWFISVLDVGPRPVPDRFFQDETRGPGGELDPP